MQLDIVKIGNSKGIRIPAHILKKCSIDDKVSLETEGEKIILKAAKKAREGWDKQFQLMRQNDDDKMLIDDLLPLEEDDWEW